jgi:hypothetical protein
MMSLAPAAVMRVMRLDLLPPCSCYEAENGFVCAGRPQSYDMLFDIILD